MNIVVSGMAIWRRARPNRQTDAYKKAIGPVLSISHRSSAVFSGHTTIPSQPLNIPSTNMQFQVSFALLAMVVCFVAAAEEVKSSPSSAQSASDRSKRGLLAAPLVAAPYVASSYVAAPYVASPYAAAPYVASPYAAAPYVASPYAAAPYVASPYAAAPYVAKTLASPYTYYP